MARPKPKTQVRGLSFRITVTPLRNGQPWPNVEPLDVLWDKAILDWHENCVDTGVMVVMRDVERRVRESMQPQRRGTLL